MHTCESRVAAPPCISHPPPPLPLTAHPALPLPVLCSAAILSHSHVTSSSTPPIARPPPFPLSRPRTVDMDRHRAAVAGIRKLQARAPDRVGEAPHQILASLACPCRLRRVPLDEGTNVAAAFTREEVGCYVLS